jgi:hypothetical protein
MILDGEFAYGLAPYTFCRTCTFATEGRLLTDHGYRYGASYLLTRAALQPTFGRIYCQYSVIRLDPSNDQ